jgi:glycosyltransferase involved in cell wall biosynthesis
MASFQRKLAGGLEKRGVGVVYSLLDQPYDAVLVIGGTRQLGGLDRVKRSGIPIYQRLDGMNWIHRVRRTGLRHFLRAEYGNFILQTIRTRIAEGIAYQSEFSRQWWERKRGMISARSTVIYNGVDLDVFTPEGQSEKPNDRYRILMVEGALAGGYEVGLENAVQMVEKLTRLDLDRPVELAVAGNVDSAVREKWLKTSTVPLVFMGQVPHERIPELDRSAHLLYSADINSACPNAVVEALACGLPVVAFDTGALPELVPPKAGRTVPYGGDPWKLDPPDLDAMARAAADALQNQQVLSKGARAQAQEYLGLDAMVQRYLDFLSHA